MLIRIIKDLADIPSFIRPRVGKVFEVKDTVFAKYQPNENFRKVIEVKGHDIYVAPSEYEVVKV